MSNLQANCALSAPGPKQLDHLSTIADQYDLFVIDIWGVVHNGTDPFFEAIDSLRRLQTHKQVLFLSNSPRPGHLAQKTLTSMGLNDQTVVFTSGDAVRQDLIHQYKNHKVYHLGAARNEDILNGLTVNLVEHVQDAELILLTQFIEGYEPIDQFDEVLKEIVARGLPVICANPDKVFLNGQDVRYCAGTFAERLENFGGQVMYYGKPDLKIYDLLISVYNDRQISKSRMLMIGDTLANDIKGAQTFGIDSLMLMTGNSGQDIQHSGQAQADYFKNYQQQHGICPTYVMAKLTW